MKLIYAFLGVVEIFEGDTSSLHRWGARTPITVSGIRFKYCHDNLSDHGKQNIKIVKNVIHLEISKLLTVNVDKINVTI